MIDYKYIKELVEVTSKIEDIGIKSRKKEVRDCRYVYAELCNKYINNFSKEDCGNEINRHRTSILHALKTFKKGIDEKWFSAKEIYYICNSTLKEMQKETTEDETVYSLENNVDNIEVENISAFPEPFVNDPHLSLLHTKGMTLRDYFASKAIGGMLSNSDLTKGFDSGEAISKKAYIVADNMLKERIKINENK